MKSSSLKLLPLFLLLGSTLLFAGQLNASESTISLMIGSFIAGLLLTFTPCVLPMVPILSSIIVGQGENVSMQKSVMLSISYVMGTAVTYAIMGVLAGATGEQLQSYFQNVWAIGAMSLVFVFMALSMFGVFTIQLPSFIQSRLNKGSTGIKGGTMPMVFVLGMISALILGACVSPVLISFLGVAISKGDAVLGGLMMFAMALGMGVPLLLLGFGAGKLLPKAGVWMDKIKYLFGILLLGVAIHLFESLSLVSPLILWGVYLIAISIFIGALDHIKQDDYTGKLLKAIGVVMLTWGILLLVGASYGSDSLSKPLHKTSVTYVQNDNANIPKAKRSHKVFTPVKNLQMLQTQLDFAKENKKTVLMYFYKDTCPVCKHLDDTTWKDASVKNVLRKKYVALKINMTDNSDQEIEAIKKKFGIFGPPGFVFFDSEGNELEDDSFYGYQAGHEMYDTLDMIATD